jgi:SAM-dependent methyltransferase
VLLDGCHTIDDVKTIPDKLLKNARVKFSARAVAASMAFAAALAFAASEDVPYIVTPDNVTLAMLEAAKVGPSDRVIDLGSGDGRIVIVAAKRFGARGLGVEIVPKLVEESRENARRAGVEARVEFREQDLFATDLRDATVITMYLLPEVNLELRPKLLALAPGTRVVSHDWDMGDWKPDRTVVVDAPDKKIGLEKKSRVHLWVVPAQVTGVWCAAGKRLEITQQFQHVKVNGRPGTVSGAAIDVPAGIALELEGARLRVTRAVNRYLELKDLSLDRAGPPGTACPSR